MAGLGDLFGKGSVAEQLLVWGVLNQAIGAVAQPFLNDVTYTVNEGIPNQEISVQELAKAVVENLLQDADGASRARNLGIDRGKFDLLVTLAETPLATQDVIAAFRRGLIPQEVADPKGASLATGLARAGIPPEWRETAAQLALQWPSPEAFLTAYLEGQTDEATARDLYAKAGGDPQFFDLLYNSQGQAPTPTEALTLLNRGIIAQDGTGPESTSYTQAFLEGPWRNKWLKPFLALREYLPPPRTVTAMLRAGSLTDAQATDLLVKQGLTAELAAAYVNDAHHTSTSGDKNLTQASVIGLYEARILPQSDALTMLEALNYSPEDAGYLLQLADVRRVISAVNAAVARIHTLYTGHKISRATAVTTLGNLQVPANQIDGIVRIWDIEAGANIKTLTPTQVADAFINKIIDQAEASAELIGQGYTPYDAWVLLSIHNKQPLPDKPAQGPAPITGTP